LQNKSDTPLVVFNSVDPWADDGKSLELALAEENKTETVDWSRRSPSDLIHIEYGKTKIAWIDTVTVIPDQDGELGSDSNRVCVNPLPTSAVQCPGTALEKMWDFVDAGKKL